MLQMRKDSLARYPLSLFHSLAFPPKPKIGCGGSRRLRWLQVVAAPGGAGIAVLPTQAAGKPRMAMRAHVGARRRPCELPGSHVWG